MPAQETAPVGLHSPPDSNSAIKDGGSDSELSDLEPEIEASEKLEVAPDHISEGGVPVFKPSMAEFVDFTRYVNAVNPYGMRSGIVKVIPPPEWLAAQPRLDEAIKTVRVKEPIKQDIMGTAGTYRQANIVHQRSYNLPQWRQLCEQSEHQPPAKRGERRANQDKPVKPAPKPKATPAPRTAKKRGAGRPPKNKSRSAAIDKDGTSTPDRLPTPVSPSMKPEDDDQSVKIEEDEYDSPAKLKGGRQPKAISVSSRRKNNKRETGVVDEAAFKDFKYELDEEFSKERCDDLERNYWKTLTYAPPLYGADMPGTLFDERTTSWNLGKLDNILDVLGSKIPGVNTAYLYLGMWKATFAWHLEDVDLYSINYVHFGAPKQWYSISQGDARRFEAAMKSIWPTDAKACDQFLRHKTFLISPSQLLSNYNIKVNKIVAHPGEFVITFPYGYHSGYNLGYNCAEAVNFGLESWLEYGRVAKKCDCSQAQDSVWIDVHEIDRKLRGQEAEYEETDDEEEEEEEEEDVKASDVPTFPQINRDIKPKAPKKKRKRLNNEKDEKSNVKRIRVRIKAPSREPCILCPNDIPSEPLLFTEDGQKAHRLCATYIPETSIESGDKDIIVDVKYISKGRLDLKCNYCRSKKGACFQCSQKKCTRAYHATCAAAAGVLVEQGEIPVFGEDGTEYKDWGIEFSCRFHRTKRDKKLEGDALGEDKRLLKAGLDLKVGDVCQMQYYRGDIFAGAVVENRISEEMILVDILPRGDRVEVEYKWLLIADPADYRLQKPSAKAIPMPKSFKDKESLNTSKRQVDDLPRAEDPFVQGCTWAEFKCEKIPRNPAQIKVDFSKENQMWFYLGKNSTEAKAQFTEDPAKPRHNPKGHFLDTIPKPAPAVSRQSYAASYPSNSKAEASSSSVAKAATRPYQPVSAAFNRPEKPYVYKPRNSAEMYNVDPKAYRDQQNFLQRSTAPAYTFGSDPRFQNSQNPRPANQYSTHAPAAKGPQQQSQAGTVGSFGSTPRPAPAMSTSRPGTAIPTPQSMYRPSNHVASPKPMNPFGSRPQPANSKQSPFAKYPYLQKEHNVSPLEYKSPYRPGGGFMNGYQGSLQAHLQQTMFRPGGSITSSISSFGGSSKPYSGPPRPSLQLQNSSSSTLPNGYHSYRTSAPAPSSIPAPVRTSVHTAAPAQQQPQAPAATASANTSDKKDNAPLHPAIRQEYNRMYNQYQAPEDSASQPQSSVLQPPAMYHRHGQLQPPYQPTITPQSQARYYPQQAAQPLPQKQNLHQPQQRTQQYSGSSNSAPQTAYKPGAVHPTSRPPVSQPEPQPSMLADNSQNQPSPSVRNAQVHSPASQQKYQSSPATNNSPVHPPAQQQYQPAQVARQSPIHPPTQQQYQPPPAARNSPVNAPVSQQQYQSSTMAMNSPALSSVSRPPYQPSPKFSESPISRPVSQQQYQRSPVVTKTQIYTPQQQYTTPVTPVSQPQYQPMPPTTNGQTHAAHSQAQYQQQSQPQDNKPIYAHQQYFQDSQIHPQVHQQASVSQASNLQVRDFPDVPADSTTLVERMMMTLKRAPAA
ncbi:uncharacterized protein L3040_004587 [Drepanopeziza brunnea f. sp. 'multigermtubi']|nr:hypothetical protein L3040_004587 [Drepanopeziza brunnea f. sp. 'multigermtubi']